MPFFDYSERDVDEDVRRESIEQRRRARRMFAWCSECMSNGHRPGCPEQTEEDRNERDS